MRSLFQEGGPFKIRRTGREQYEMSIPLPTDREGRAARECPSEGCSPGYFKVKPGTGITEHQAEAFCPYCRFRSKPGKFHTQGQLEYAKSVIKREAVSGVEGMVREAFGIGSSGKKTFGNGPIKLEFSIKKGSPPPIYRPFEEALQRVVVCLHCNLDHAVFGLAVWCPDCGKDIFLTHVESELRVLQSMLSDIPRRQEILGHRTVARDIENCLEDTVSIYEAVLRALLVRELRRQGKTPEEVLDILRRRVGNKLQSIPLSETTFREVLGIDLFAGNSLDTVEQTRDIFEKRHPITHNLGITDRKYLERLRSVEREGREILVTIDEVSSAISFVLKITSELHHRLFSYDQDPS